ncbi:hypothetical protein [Streptomyces koyangensis]|uniref:hypothetical protein n=1 Tax=Streptomyces koyangensis TaxID=188770 RepID=UPI003BF60540
MSDTVIRKTPKELHEQRARLIASTGLSEKVLRERGEAFQLYPEHQAVWDTVHGIDYLLDSTEAPESEPHTADRLRGDLLHALEFAQCANLDYKNLGYATPEQMLDAYDAARTAEQTVDDRQTLAAALSGLETLIVTSSRDWGTYRVDAWIWAVLVGWDCEEDQHNASCSHEALEEVAAVHGWTDDTVAKARRYRTAVRRLTAEAKAEGDR